MREEVQQHLAMTVAMYPPGHLALGAATGLVLRKGYTSARVQEDVDPWQYNPNNGYPAVGSRYWHL